MKYLLIALAALTIVCRPTFAEELMRLNLDDKSVIGTVIQTDTVEKAEGQASVRIDTLWPTTICLGEVANLDIENARLIYQANVKSDLSGMAFLEMWVHIGEDRYFSKGMNDTVKDRSEWKTIRTPFLFRQGQSPDKVTLNLVINGSGSVWIDDIVLLKTPLK